MIKVEHQTKRVRFDDRKWNTYKKKNTKSYADTTRRNSYKYVPEATKATKRSIKTIATKKGHSVSSINYLEKSNGEKYPTGKPGGRMGYTESKVSKNKDKHHWLERGRDDTEKTWTPVGKMNECLVTRN